MPDHKSFREWLGRTLPSLPPEQQVQVLHQLAVQNSERIDTLEAWQASLDALRRRALYWLLALAILAANLGPEKAVEIIGKALIKVIGAG